MTFDPMAQSRASSKTATSSRSLSACLNCRARKQKVSLLNVRLRTHLFATLEHSVLNLRASFFRAAVFAQSILTRVLVRWKKVGFIPTVAMNLAEMDADSCPMHAPGLFAAGVEVMLSPVRGPIGKSGWSCPHHGAHALSSWLWI